MADRRPLALEIATTANGRDITRGYVDAMPYVMPTDRMLALAGGLRGYEEMLRDDQVAACFGQRRLAVVSRPWTVVEGGPRRIDRQAADLLRSTLDSVAWDATTDGMLYARFYGFAVAEVIWRADRAGISLDDIKVRDRARFAFSPRGELLLRTTGNPNGEMLPDRKFWRVAVGASHADEPYGTGLAQALYWPVWFKRQGARFWATFLEKFGAPTAVGTFPDGTSDESRARLLAALAAVHSDSGIALPEGMKIELLEATRGGTVNYQDWMGYWDRAIAKVVLGQTMTTEDGSSRSQAEVHWDVRADIVRADADLVCASANRSWVRWLIDLTLPGAAYPQVWRDMTASEDLDSRAKRDETLFKVGFRLTPEAVEQVYGDGYLPVEPPPPDTRSAAPTSLATERGCPVHGTVHASEGPAPVTVDSLIADQLERETEAAWTDTMNRVRDIVAGAQSLQELRDALLASFGEIGIDELADVMAMAFAAAELAGMQQAREDSRG